MDQLDFDGSELKNDLLNDAGEFVGESADAYEDGRNLPQSGHKKINPLLLIAGFSATAAGAYLANVYTYVLCFVALLVGYHIFTEKNKTKTTYKYNKIARAFGAILVLVTVAVILLTKYEVL